MTLWNRILYFQNLAPQVPQVPFGVGARCGPIKSRVRPKCPKCPKSAPRARELWRQSEIGFCVVEWLAGEQNNFLFCILSWGTWGSWGKCNNGGHNCAPQLHVSGHLELGHLGRCKNKRERAANVVRLLEPSIRPSVPPSGGPPARGNAGGNLPPALAQQCGGGARNA